MADVSVGGNSKAQLRSIVDRIENIETDIAGLQGDRKEIYAEAKSNGFDVKALRNVIRIRKEDQAKRAELQALVDTYMHALGMIADLPLGRAAIQRTTGQTDLEDAVAAKQ